MSQNIKKTALALAVMAACVLAAPAAFAVTVDNTSGGAPSSFGPLPVSVAFVDVASASTPVALDALNINISNTDLIIGRTTGFSVRIDLPAGATFAALPAPTIGAALKCSLIPNTSTGCWSVTLAAGGTSTDSYAVYSVQPGTSSQGVINGQVLSWASTGIKLAGVANLGTVGGSVAAKITFADPNTAQVILTPVTQTLITSADPLNYSDTLATGGAKIDVGSPAGILSKTAFSPNGSLSNTGDVRYFDAGKLSFGVNNNVRDNTGVPFAWVNGTTSPDSVALTVTGNFNAFTQPNASVTLVTGTASCSAPGTPILGTITGSQVTFATTMAALATTNAAELCFNVPGSNTMPIDATSVATSATVTRTNGGKTTSGAAAANAMAYNGPVAVVYTFNPAGNTSQQSFLRISNTGTTGGLVTITGKDDNGVAAAGSVSMMLGAGKSVQLTSTDLQNGNAAKGLTGALGTGTGKWILTVTGQINGMQVTNLNRNNTSGTVSNLGTPVSGAN